MLFRSYSIDRDARVAVFALSGQPYAVNLDGPSAPRLLDAPGPVIDPRVDPTGTKVAYVCDRGLFVVPLVGGHAAAMCRPEHDDDAWGLADFIAAEELDRTRGYWWLSDGSGLLVEHYDETPVSTWWIADPAQPGSAPREHRYPAAGTANAEVSLWLVRLDEDGDVVRDEVAWDHADYPYLATVSVPGHGDPVISVLSRDQRRQRVIGVDPVTAQTTVLAEHRDPDWIDVIPGVPSVSPSGALIEIVADRDTDTYRLTSDSKMLTPPGLQVSAVLDIAESDILVLASDDPTTDRLMTIGYDGTAKTLPVEGMMSARRRGDVTVISATDLDRTSTRTTVWRGDQPVRDVTSLAESPLISPRVELMLTGPRDLRTAVLFPTGHERGFRRLPVIMSPYGGPHARLVVRAGLTFGTDQWLADQGYCVVVADGRARQVFVGMIGLHRRLLHQPARDADRIGEIGRAHV